MHRSIFTLTALSAAAGAVVAPLPTRPARLQERQLPSATGALGTDPSSSRVTRTFAYFSGGQTEGVVLWAPFTYAPDGYSFTSSGQFWRGCSKTYYQTIGTSISADTECPLFTTCSDGWLKWSTKSVFCVQAGSSCYTDILYETYGATDGLSWLYCNTASTDVVTAFRTRPPLDVPATTTKPTTPITTPSSTSPAPTSSSSAPPPNPPPAPKKSNAGVIAGSVVGGVAVIALAAVAIFYILRRHKTNAASAAGGAGAAGAAGAAAAPTYQEYKPEKPVGQVTSDSYYAAPTQGEYNPHTSGIYSVGSASPTAQSAVPAYEPYQQGQHVQRNELPS